jgi:hypothetical protein
VASNGATSTPGWRNGTKVDTEATYRFDPVDREQMRWLGRLPPGRRVRVMLEARELAVGLIRGRLRRHYPHLSLHELNLRTLEEIERVKRAAPGP